MKKVKTGSWLHDLIEVYNDLGGKAAYKDVYPRAKLRREARGASWTPNAEATIRRTVEDHAESSANFKGTSVVTTQHVFHHFLIDGWIAL